jgi:probable phosphoglycerate mutase
VKPNSPPLVYLARHGETEWTITGQHTGLTDLPLTEHGEAQARKLGPALAGIDFASVATSPLHRAVRTCELAGFASAAVTDSDLLEWNYGDYEGKLRTDILVTDPHWQLFRDGCPGGESPRQIAARADRVIERARAADGNVLLFSSGHFFRMLAARWLALKPIHGAHFVLDTASLSILGYEHDLTEPVIRQWNDFR